MSFPWSKLETRSSCEHEESVGRGSNPACRIGGGFGLWFQLAEDLEIGDSSKDVRRSSGATIGEVVEVEEFYPVIDNVAKITGL